MAVVLPATIEEVQRADSYAVVRCVNCQCVNTAWIGGDSWNRIFGEKILRRSDALCTKANCKCHTTGGTLQAKKVEVGLEAPF